MISSQNLKIWNLLNKKQKITALLIFVMMIVSMALETLSISLLYPVVSIFIEKDSNIEIINYLMNKFNFKNSFSFIIFILFFIFVIKNIFLFFFTLYKNKFSSNVHFTLTSSLLKKYIDNNYLFHTIRNSSLLIRNITQEVPMIHNVILQFMIIFTEILVIAGISIFLIYINPLVTFYIFLMSLLFFLIHYFFINNYADHLGKLKVYHTGEFIKHFMQGLGSIKLTKILGKHEYFKNNFNKHMLQYTNINYVQRTIAEAPRLFIEIISLSSIILLVYYLLFFRNNELSSVLAFLTVYLASLIRIVPSISRVMSALTVLSSSNKSIQVIYDDLKTNEFNDLYILKTSQIENFKFKSEGILDIKNISFNYPDRNKVIKDVTLTIKSGEVIGLIGQSGSGKSTLVDLIIGILEINSGSINYNNINIFNNINSWKKLIGYVPQEIYLTDDSILNNIAFGEYVSNINKDKINILLKELNLYEFISSLPNGVETKVGERGIQISGGQLQRIGIARALYHDPSIIILDEATSALDKDNEDLIINQINKFRKNKIIIIVSHKYNSVKICDRIYKLENGSLNLHERD